MMRHNKVCFVPKLSKVEGKQCTSTEIRAVSSFILKYRVAEKALKKNSPDTSAD